uniref:WAP domain-containing protein n=1 Tax=Rhabditophanes sp. KR3021 TaxID=114890 RepID=A0AC35TUR9_9BILA
MKSTECESNVMCYGNNGRCCTNPTSRCPLISTLNVRCISRNPINWCSIDTECGIRSSRDIRQHHICCPTGCDYNICTAPVSNPFTTPKSIYPKKALIEENIHPDCPPLNKMHMTCKSQKPVSWCFKQSDCISNSVLTRRCCNTPCHYSACIIKMSNKWLIG